MTDKPAPVFQVIQAETEEDIRQAQALRFQVFVSEMGGRTSAANTAARLERDRFDDRADHLLLRDLTRPCGDQTIGTYRLRGPDTGAGWGPFYSDEEFDLSALHAQGRPVMELSRSCLHPDYRGGAGMVHLWGGLADIVARRGVELLFGVASFGTTDLTQILPAVSNLHHAHLAPASLRVISRQAEQPRFLGPENINKLQAMRDTPALIKAYLRLGGVIGQGVYVDRDFGTTDVCMILDTATLRHKSIALYQSGRRR